MRLLDSEGWAVVVAEHGRSAMELMREGRDHFDCVVSDVNMPELDGFGLIEEIRSCDDDIPVLLMTGDPSLNGAVRAIEHGAVSYLAKPFDQEALASAVARAARQHGVTRMRRRAELIANEVELRSGERAEVAARFQLALEHAWIAFQPIVDLKHKRVFAYEALVRTEEESLRRPDVFIATAERLDRIPEFGRTVRGAVARAASNAPPGVKLFVNVHGLEFADDDLFLDHGPFASLAPSVVLELTERIGFDVVSSPARVATLRRIGYQIAVDDLGAGYSALGALATLEPDIVKLDMSLIRDLHQDAKKRRIVGAITTLVRELGGRVVAEGVETEPELDAARDAGIELVQGFLFARPTREFSTPAC
jgi:EAL domain-containing protein (putative c-di-GMP-specific phosphodiesterase class I)/CheY-like chemotaxis protein